MKQFVAIMVLFVLIVFNTGCNKCDPSNSVGGLVIEDAIVRVMVATPNEPLFITSAEQVNFDVEYSLNGGLDYQLVDFSEYSVLCFPTTANCSSGYERIVERDNANSIVIYTINITQCDNCMSQARIANWVLVPAVPPSFSPVFKLND
jgi:hypothetical protein